MTASRIGRLLVVPVLVFGAPAAGATAVTTTETVATPTASASTSATTLTSASASAAMPTVASTATSTSTTATSSATVSRLTAATTSGAAPGPRPRPVAVSFGVRSGDPPVAVVDFAFHPGTVTVHVGDTVSWTNSGKQPHTATADGGSFDTGILKSGQSASHTFSRAGTFTYFCAVHPFMKGTVVVLAAAGGAPATRPANSGTASAPVAATTAAGAAAPAASPSASTPASAASTLPMTGMPVLVTLSLGLVLIGLGAAGWSIARGAADNR